MEVVEILRSRERERERERERGERVRESRDGEDAQFVRITNR